MEMSVWSFHFNIFDLSIDLKFITLGVDLSIQWHVFNLEKRYLLNFTDFKGHIVTFLLLKLP